MTEEEALSAAWDAVNAAAQHYTGRAAWPSYLWYYLRDAATKANNFRDVVSVPSRVVKRFQETGEHTACASLDAAENVPDDGHTPDWVCQRKDLLDAVKAGFVKLSPIQREILNRHYSLGQPMPDIARALKVTHSWVNICRARALLTLKKYVRNLDGNWR